MIKKNTYFNGSFNLTPYEMLMGRMETTIACLKTEKLMRNISTLLTQQQNCSEQTRLYSLSEAARKLGIGYDSLKTLIENGRIGIIQIAQNYKVPHTEIIRFLEEEIVYMQSSQPTRAAYEQLMEENPSASTVYTDDEIFNQIINKEN